MTYAYVFPGQGSQKVGMGSDLMNLPEVKALFTQASDYLGRDMAKMCIEGPTDLLTKTENAQPAIFLISAALWTQLLKKGHHPQMVAGHSLGEITAYYVSGVLSFEDTLRVIRIRGDAMGAACPEGSAGMAAIMGLSVEVISETLVPYADVPVVIANYNCPGQIVISGKKPVLQEACDALKAAGGKVIPLPVSGAFHSPMMGPAAETLRQHIASTTFRDAAFPIVLNRTAQPETQGSVLKENLPLQVVSSVQWIDTVGYLSKHVQQIVEVGPGKVLQGLIKKTHPALDIRGICTAEELAVF